MRSALSFICGAVLALLSCFPGAAIAEEDIVTVFVPSVPGIEKLLSENRTEIQNKKSIWKNDDIPEADILMSLMKPGAYLPYPMDMPQSFAMIFQADAEGAEPVRRDLLGDVEEIRYLDKKAWGANVALAEPGLYQFILEGKPFWDERKEIFLQQSAKLFLPVLSDGSGWSSPVSQGLEIVPLTRPYGLSSPALFSARVMSDGNAVSGALVKAGRMNINKKAPATRWLDILETVTGPDGIFSIVLNQAGWWYCEAVVQGEPLKGPDGQMKEAVKSAIIWLYVNGNQ